MDEKIYHVTAGVFVLSGVALGILYPADCGLYLGLAAPLFPLLPAAFERMNIKIPYRLWVFVFVYLILGYNIGLIMDGYKLLTMYYYDKFVHFISGFVFTVIGLCVFFYMRKSKRRNWGLGLLFALDFSMLIAVVFELMEYAVYLITGTDPQHNLTTGVVDTMEDMALCLCASLITVLFYFVYYRKGFGLWKKPIIDEFCELNGLVD